MNSIGLSNMFSQDTYDRIFGNKTIELEQYLQGKATDSCDEATRLFMAIEKKLGNSFINGSFDCSWVMRRNASAASAETISDKILPHKKERSILACAMAVKKPASENSSRKSYNFDGPSKSMEDFCLKENLANFERLFKGTSFKLNMTIDGQSCLIWK